MQTSCCVIFEITVTVGKPIKFSMAFSNVPVFLLNVFLGSNMNELAEHTFYHQTYMPCKTFNPALVLNLKSFAVFSSGVFSQLCGFASLTLGNIASHKTF